MLGPRTTPEPREGELYKVIEAYGKRFDIYYGYYEESDRQSSYARPIELYPNFINSPIYTDDGTPFATAMQRHCEYFEGESDEDNTCYQCSHYEGCDELLGICRCKSRRKNE